MKETLKQKIMKYDFKDDLTVREGRKDLMVPNMLYSRNNPTNLDSIILKSVRLNENNQPAYNFRTKFNTPRESSHIDVF